MKQIFDVKGMTCAACVSHVEKAAKKVKGVTQVNVSLLNGTAQVEGDFDAQNVCASIRKAGYEAFPSGEMNLSVTGNREENLILRLVFSAGFLLLLMYVSMGAMLGLSMPRFLAGKENIMVTVLMQLLLAVPIVFLNRFYYQRGLKALIHASPNMDSLVAVGSLVSLLYSLWNAFGAAAALGKNDIVLAAAYRDRLCFDSAAMILTMVTIGKTLEGRSRKKTGEAVEKLKKLVPDRVTVLKDGQEMMVPVDQVRIDDVVLIRPGQRVPVDGVILSGMCCTDESAVTGESMPVFHQKGETLISGVIVTDSKILLKAQKVGQDTTLNGIIRMVTDSASTKPPVALLADRIAGMFVPCVMGIAFITAFVWVLISADLTAALNRAVSVLVISCPCALGLATPMAVTVGIGKGASSGILYRSASAIEACGRVTDAVFDKTGTLTEGRPVVESVYQYGISPEELAKMACALESGSSHPIAKAVCQYFGIKDLPEVTAFEERPGSGVRALIDGSEYCAGNKRMMTEENVIMMEDDQDQNEGTILYLAQNGKEVGKICLHDPLKKESIEAVKLLKEMGIRVHLLTGDRRQTAEQIAKHAGIDHVIAEVMPKDKEKIVQELQLQGKRVLMIGDGINDAPALSTAYVGAAVGNGSDIAVDAADLILMKSNPCDVPAAIRLSQKVIRNIRENLFWAFIYNLICIPLAAGVFSFAGLTMNPMIGSVCMSMSSVCVCLNALRLRRFGREQAQGDPRKGLNEKEILETVPHYRHVQLHIDGMMCEHCEATVREILMTYGATEINVSHELKRASFLLSDHTVKEPILNAIRNEDYEPGEWTESED